MIIVLGLEFRPFTPLVSFSLYVFLLLFICSYSFYFPLAGLLCHLCVLYFQVHFSAPLISLRLSNPGSVQSKHFQKLSESFRLFQMQREKIFSGQMFDAFVQSRNSPTKIPNSELTTGVFIV